jgi:glycerophosphoryl diester phosphodiesterase
VSASLHWLTARPIAHRGLHDKAKGIIENTASAAKAAIAGNYAIECDVQLTADGEAVVFHDFTLDRLTSGKGPVAALSAAALAELAIREAADRIMALGDWLSLIASRSVAVIEIKSDFSGDMRLAHRTAEVVKGYDGPFALKSFDPAIVKELRKVAPAVPRGIIAMNDYDHHDYVRLTPAQKHALANLLHFSQTRPDFLSWRVGDLPVAAPFLCRTQLGLPVMTWTVRTQEERAIASAHADQMVFEGFRP